MQLRLTWMSLACSIYILIIKYLGINERIGHIFILVWWWHPTKKLKVNPRNFTHLSVFAGLGEYHSIREKKLV